DTDYLPVAEPEPAAEPEQAIPVSAPSLPPPRRAREHAPEFAAVLSGSSHSRWWAAAIFCAVLRIGAGVVYGFRSRTRAQWPALHPDARPVNGDLVLSWDAGAHSATTGRLNVVDGDVRREIDLKPEDIRAGRMQCTPLRPDVALRLTLFDHGAAVA